MEPQETNGTAVHLPAPSTTTATSSVLIPQDQLMGEGETADDFYRGNTGDWVKDGQVWRLRKGATTSKSSWYTKRDFRLQEPVVPPIDCPTFADLRHMLCYRRDGRTRTEKKFIHRFLAPLSMKVDGYGNYFKRIGDAPVMWACHTDSVHSGGGMQQLAYETATGLLCLGSKEKSNCLGADDAAGIWLMTEMIKAGVEGLYVFHRDEESGAGGSRHFAKYGAAVYKHVNMCISLDRYGYDSVITHQFGRCCSDEFARGLAAELNKLNSVFTYAPDSTGMFTDSANYTDDIAECTNLSVGYWGHHTRSEEVSVPHLLRLRDALCQLDVSAIPIKRNPADNDGYGGYFDKFDKADRMTGNELYRKGKAYGSYGGKEEDAEAAAFSELDDITASSESMFDMVCGHPEEIVDLLEEYGFDAKSLRLEMVKRGAP